MKLCRPRLATAARLLWNFIALALSRGEWLSGDIQPIRTGEVSYEQIQIFFRIRSELNKTDKSIKIAGPKIWNKLPKTIRKNFEKAKPFKNALKKHLLHSQEF